MGEKGGRKGGKKARKKGGGGGEALAVYTGDGGKSSWKGGKKGAGKGPGNDYMKGGPRKGKGSFKSDEDDMVAFQLARKGMKGFGKEKGNRRQNSRLRNKA